MPLSSKKNEPNRTILHVSGPCLFFALNRPLKPVESRIFAVFLLTMEKYGNIMTMQSFAMTQQKTIGTAYSACSHSKNEEHVS